MKPKSQPADELLLFQAHFDQMLNLQHELVQLARQIDWSRFDRAFADCYSPDMGAPAKAVRLMVGLHYLKHAFNESDESVMARWVENPYWQYFCGYTHMQHICPIHPTSMTKWRHRVGGQKLAAMLAETIDLAVRRKHLPRRDLQRVIVDTTVQEKNITYPTDSKLLYKLVVKLVAAARRQGIRLRQTYIRVGKFASIRAGRYAHAKQFGKMRREHRRLKTYVGRLMRDIRRNASGVGGELAKLFELAERLIKQQPQDKDKLYSLHEPEVRCISKGKVHKRYEFGQKVSVATTNRGNWIVAAEMVPGNPYDGHTLAQALQAVEAITGMAVTEACVDKGYRGHDYIGQATVHIGMGSRHRPRAERLRRRRRSAVEPKIGHLKSENRMGRCFLRGLVGDAINALLAAAGSNLRKLLALFLCAFTNWLNLTIKTAQNSLVPQHDLTLRAT
jgi:transposase, IS5 family